MNRPALLTKPSTPLVPTEEETGVSPEARSRRAARPPRSRRAKAGNWAVAHPVWAATAVAAAVRVVAVAVVSVSDLLVRIAPDTFDFVRVAGIWAEGDTDEWSRYDEFRFDHFRTYLLPLGLLMRAFGHHVILAQALSVILGIATVAVVTLLTSRWLGSRWALGAGLVAALMPAQVIWSSVGLRDPLAWTLAAGLALVVAMARNETGRRLAVLGLLAAVLVILLAFVRLQTVIVVSWALFLTALVVPAVSARWLRALGAAAILLVGPWMAGAGPAGITTIRTRNFTEMRVLNSVGAETGIASNWTPTDEYTRFVENSLAFKVRHQQALESGSPVVPNADPEAPEVIAPGIEADGVVTPEKKELVTEAVDPRVGAVESDGLWAEVRHLPKGVSVVLFEPFPWSPLRTAVTRVAAIESLVWYPALALALVGLAAAVRRRLWDLFFPVLMAGGLLLVYALSEGNLGTAHRHRGEIVWVTVLLATIGGQAAWARYRSRTAGAVPVALGKADAEPGDALRG